MKLRFVRGETTPQGPSCATGDSMNNNLKYGLFFLGGVALGAIGAVAVSCAAWNSKLFSSLRWKIVFSVITLLIILSTVFLKQHSVVDVFWAFVLMAVAAPVFYSRRLFKKKPPMQTVSE